MKLFTITLVAHLQYSVDLQHSKTHSISVELYVDGKIKRIGRRCRLVVCQCDLDTRHLFCGVKNIVMHKGHDTPVRMYTRQ